MATDWVIVKRLVKLYDPRNRAFPRETHPALNSALLTPAYLNQVRPQLEHVDYDQRSSNYHVGRVRYFVDRLRSGEAVEAIELDAYCSGMYIGGPIVVDGHHRLMAHWILRKRRIQVSFSGRLNVLKYLKGNRRTPPPDIV